MLFSSSEAPLLSLPECHKCGLYKKCNSPKMLPSGSGKRRILFIGEAPGKEEDAVGKQFVGKAGKYLRKKLDDLGCDLDDCRVTNSIICRPPENKMDARYVSACAPTIRRLLRDEKFDVIVTLGEWALQQVIPEAYSRYGGGMAKWRGWTIPLDGCWLCPVYHPSYILRSDEDPILVQMFVSDLERALNCEKVIQEVPPITLPALKNSVEIIEKPHSRLADLATKRGLLAFDYETTGLKPEMKGHRIVSCSFCFEGRDTWAFKVTDELLPELGRILFSKNLKKIASNLKFEERWTRHFFGRGVAEWYWDTMLAAHVLDNRSGVTSIKFQSFVRLGVGGWEDDVKGYLRAEGSNEKNRIDFIPAHDLLLYNGLDSLIEFMVMLHQKREIGYIR